MSIDLQLLTDLNMQELEQRPGVYYLSQLGIYILAYEF
jgi:hypothetical protein